MRDTIAPMSPRGRTIYDLKIKAHNMIDRLAYMGVSRNRAYQLLAKELGIPEPQAHFSQMHTIEEVQRAIVALRIIDKRTGRLIYAADKKKSKIPPVPPPPPPAPKPKPTPSKGVFYADPTIVREALKEVTRRNALRAQRRRRYWFLAWLITF